jgi:hypothetical protein
MADLSYKAGHSPGAVGISVFAAAMLMMAGLSQAFTALAALINDTFLVKVGGYIYAFDSTTWGWIHLLLGAALVVVGLFIFMAKPWAFIAGIILAIVNGLLNFLWLPIYPIWALVLIGLNVLVIWALATTRKA